MSKYTINEIKELMAMGWTPEQIARLCGDAPARKDKKPTGKPARAHSAAEIEAAIEASKHAPELVEFKNKAGKVKFVTPAQAAAWDKYRNRNSKTLDEVKAEWEAKHKAYKPSKELKEAIKANRAGITLAVAKEKFGFVGTKQELKALKEKVLK